MSATLTQTQISSLYVTVFNRASEGQGNQFWQGLNKPIADTATEMLNSSASRDYFGTNWDSDQLFIEHIYKNTLNKTLTEDPDGIAFWVTRLDTESRGEVVEAIVKAISGDFTGNTKALEAQEQFNNRVEVSNYMANTVFETPDNYVQVTGFNGDLTVTSDKATVTSAKETIDSPNGKIIVITDGGNYNGTNSNDTFITSRGEIDGVVIQAKGGDDILQATVSSGADNENSDTGLALISYDLETVNLRNLAGSTTLDLLQANGLEEVWNDRSSSSTILTLDNVSTDVTVGIRKTSSDTKVNYQEVSGSADTVNVKLNGSKEGASFVVPNIENINLAVDSNSYLDISSTLNGALETIDITSTVDTETKLKLKDSSTLNIKGGEGKETLVLSDSVVATTSKVENVELEFTAASTFQAVNLVDVTNIKVDATHDSANVISYLLADTDLTVVGDVQSSLAVSFNDGASKNNSLKMELDSLVTDVTVADIQTVDKLIVDTLETLNISVLGDNNDSTTITVLEADALKTLDIDSQESSFEIGTFTDSTTLKSIDTTGFGGALSLGELNNLSGVNIALGNQNSNSTAVSLTLESDKSISDTITFGNALVGDVTITNFKVGEHLTGDNLDFSVYGVESMGDLAITSSVANSDEGIVTINILNDDNFGSIKLTGVILDNLDDSNFDFA